MCTHPHSPMCLVSSYLNAKRFLYCSKCFLMYPSPVLKVIDPANKMNVPNQFEKCNNYRKWIPNYLHVLAWRTPPPQPIKEGKWRPYKMPWLTFAAFRTLASPMSSQQSNQSQLPLFTKCLSTLILPTERLSSQAVEDTTKRQPFAPLW